MLPTHSDKPRRRRAALNPEILEDRCLMTFGAGSMFAVMPGTATAGKASQVSFTIDPSHFTLPKGKFELGIDVTPASGSTVKPVILTVVDSSGRPIRTTHSVYDPKVQRNNTSAGKYTTAVIAEVGFSKKGSPAPATYTVDVMAQGTTSGNYLLGFYLPGDANGDGVIDQTDIKKIKAELRTNANATNYTFDADSNRDGKISMSDVQIAEQNMGVKTTINPTISANLDPTNDPGLSQGVVKSSPIHYTGVATSGATIVYQGTNQGDKPVSTVTDASGKYSLNVPVDKGENVFKVSSHDAFQQSISGTITPVTYLVTPSKPTSTTK
jgi:hypothetical protein